jgi:hypothetical protein
MSILINSDAATPQPNGKPALIEGKEQIQSDNRSINGSRQRNRLGEKKWARLTWEALLPSDYQTLIDYFTSGTAVTYSNSASVYAGGTFSFTGLPDQPEEGEYWRGSTLIRSMSVTIREV